MARACGATRPPVQDAGWECNGTGLIVVITTATQGVWLPVVLPARALDVIEPDSWWDLPVQPFTGGDHLHLVVPRRPTTFKGDTMLVRGDAALSMKELGPVASDGPARIGISFGPGVLYVGGPA
jgi:hypothetical protein